MTLHTPRGLVAAQDPRLVIKRRMAQPRATHFRMATCEEVGCKHFLFGWTTLLGVTETDMLDLMKITIKEQHYRVIEERVGEGMIAFHFPAGQPCFAAHKHIAQTGRPPTLLKMNKDGMAHEQEADRFCGEHNEELYAAHQEYKQGDIKGG